MRAVAVLAGRSRRDWLWPVGLVVLVFLAYQPAWRAGFIWDDPAHVTRPELRPLGGLARIWFEPGATQQFYPLLHSAFWLEHRVFGGNATGYHLVNIALHALNAVLVGLLLRRLRVRVAWLAAAMFALHPVMVESVAWVSELKNVLSGAFYLGAALAYLQFDARRTPRWYALAAGLFVLGLLSKTVIATLPGGLLVVLWWQRGRLEWRRDVLPLLPFFTLGAAAGLLTASIEQGMLNEDGAALGLSAVERVLLAGRALWFYAWKMLWPAGLAFIYPRWSVDDSVWWQYLFPAAFGLVAVGLWRWRDGARGPLAAVLFFAGTLFPALGFVNVFPFIYSYVADHFQYLACLGLIVPVAVVLGGFEGRGAPPSTLRASGAVALAALGCVTWHQSASYDNAVRLYETTLARNPDCWFAHNNLGAILVGTERRAEGIAHFRAAARLAPDNAAAHCNLGVEAIKDGRPGEAAEHYAAAARAKPHDATIRNSLGAALLAAQRPAEAVPVLEVALRLRPDYVQARHNLALAVARLGRVPDAIAQLKICLRLEPAHPEARANLLRLEEYLRTHPQPN